MAESESGADKTEDPTDKRKKDSREKGEIARSKELNTLAVMVAGCGALLAFGGHLAQSLLELKRSDFTLSREVLLDEPLKALEDEFGDRFVRIHRNALVARERIERLQRTPLGHFQLYLKGLNGDALIVSRRHVAGVRKMMQQL